MLAFAIISILTFTVGTWGILSGSLYRNPLYLCIFGLFLAIAGGYMAYAFDVYSQNSTMVEVFGNLKLSSSLISYTVVAAGGSLIASGIVLKAQHLAKRDITEAKLKIKMLISELNSIKKSAQEIIENDQNLDIKALEKKLSHLKTHLCRVEIRLNIAMKETNKLDN